MTSGFLDVSTDQKNIFVISFDALQTDNVKSILDHHPDLKKEFDGFINFSNVAAIAPYTLLSVVTTKLGYLPPTNIDSETLQKRYSKDFITTILNKMNYETSTYAAFNYEEPKNTIIVHRTQIAPQNINFYQLAVKNSLQKYIPTDFDHGIIQFNNAINNFDTIIKKPQNDSSPLYKIIMNDPHEIAHAKTDIIHFNYFTDHLKPAVGKNTAHFHHYVFTHNPTAFDANCAYRIIDTVQQNNEANLQETECAIKEFITFLKKLKTMQAFDNSLIIFASDHGYECEYNDSSIAPGAYKISERWCLSRYQPLLMIKPFNANGTLKNELFEASLIDISKTICEATTNDSAICKKYVGVDLLNIQPNDTAKERGILVTNPSVDADAREYNDFHIVNIGRMKTLPEYYGISSSTKGILPLTILAQDLPSEIGGNVSSSGRQALPSQHKAGFLTYGPYLDLPPGKYSIELIYKSSASEKSIIGFSGYRHPSR